MIFVMNNNLENLFEHFKIQIKKRKGHRWATFNTFGERYPHSRNIIIRELNDNSLFFFTHSLSQKVEDINRNSATSLCWYDQKHHLQLQFFGETKIANSKTISKYKENIQNFRDYQGPRPGSPITSLFDKDIHFTVLQMQIDELIALRLGRESHRKTKFVFHNGETLKTEVTP
mgnify:CR=1 FL=1|tara:strand:+ start:4212 stop:4730 length:519 start_codon:yes stop_codon:yes gene_type:complete